jgi:hypothetical protein
MNKLIKLLSINIDYKIDLIKSIIQIYINENH